MKRIIHYITILFSSSKNRRYEETLPSEADLANAPLSPNIIDSNIKVEEPSLDTSQNADSSKADIKSALESLVASISEETRELKSIISKLDLEDLQQEAAVNPKYIEASSVFPETCKEKPTEEVEEEPVVKENEEEVRPQSLLDNTPYLSLAESCCDLIKELEQQQTDENGETVSLAKSRIIEALISSGATPIAEETSFDVVRHTPEVKAIVRKGTPILATVQAGVAIDDKVIIKAIVKVK